MQLGYVSAILPNASRDELFSTANRLGYQCVELMCWPPGEANRRYAGVTHIDLTNFDDATADQIRQSAESNNVSISALGYYPNPLSPDPAESEVAIAQLRRLIQASAKLGVNKVNSFIGRDWTKSIDDNWPRFVEVWKPLIELAEQHGVQVGIENCPMFFTHNEWPGGKNLATSPAIWRRMFDAIPSSNFGLNYDPSHMVWQQMDYLAPIKNFADRLFHIHAKDVRLDRDRLNEVGMYAPPNQFHSPKLPGLGEIDWGAFFSTLFDVGYHGPVCVEVEDRAYEHSDELRHKALAQSATYLRNFLPSDF